jgi:hypothetical protein
MSNPWREGTKTYTIKAGSGKWGEKEINVDEKVVIEMQPDNKAVVTFSDGQPTQFDVSADTYCLHLSPDGENSEYQISKTGKFKAIFGIYEKRDQGTTNPEEVGVWGADDDGGQPG